MAVGAMPNHPLFDDVVLAMASTLSTLQPSTRSISSTTAASTKPGHIALHRRLLFPHLPASSPVPALLRNASPELNAELYDLLALALRAHITPWWSKITRYDRDFIPQVAAILSHVLRVFEERVVEADLTDVLFRALPIVLTQHYEDYRAAEDKVGTSYAAGGAMDVPQLFHQLQGHMAIDAEGHIDPSYIRHTLDHVLEACLPAEDFESDAEHAIVREVIAKVVMNDIAPLLVQPWFIHKIVLGVLRPGSEKSQTPPASKTTHESATSRASGPTFHTVVVFVLSSVQYLSGLCLAIIQFYKQTVQAIVLVNSSAGGKRVAGAATAPLGYGACILNLVAAMMTLEKRSASKAVLVLLEILTLSFSSFSDRFLTYGSHKYIVTEEAVLSAVKTSKQTLYPNGYPGPPPMMPTPEEQGMMKEQVISQLLDRVPALLAVVLLGPKTRETMEDALAPLSSTVCNAHLLLLLLDLMIVSLFPELAGPVVGREAGSVGSVSSRPESPLSSDGRVNPIASDE